jgi:hypothetical protein
VLAVNVVVIWAIAVGIGNFTFIGKNRRNGIILTALDFGNPFAIIGVKLQ